MEHAYSLLVISLLCLKLTSGQQGGEEVQQISQQKATGSTECENGEFQELVGGLSGVIKNKMEIFLNTLHRLSAQSDVTPEDAAKQRLNAGIDLLVAAAENGLSEDMRGCVKRYLENEVDLALELLEKTQIENSFKAVPRNVLNWLKTDLQKLAGENQDIPTIIRSIKARKRALNHLYSVYEKTQRPR